MGELSTAGKTREKIAGLVPVWWPVFLSVMAVIVMGVRADASLAHTIDRVEVIEADTRTTPERLARIETQLIAQGEQLNRMEQRLEAMR